MTVAQQRSCTESKHIQISKVPGVMKEVILFITGWQRSVMSFLSSALKSASDNETAQHAAGCAYTLFKMQKVLKVIFVAWFTGKI